MFTCPMHPEVREAAHGACPYCGMGLEATEPLQADGRVNPELRDLRQRLLVSILLSLPLMAIAMDDILPGPSLSAQLPLVLLPWLQLLLATPVVFYGGGAFFARAAASLRSGNLNMFTLVALGTGVAWLASLFAVLTPELVPASFRTAGGAVPLYFESAAMIVTLVLFGQVLETRARLRSGDALRALLELAPPSARLVAANGSEREIPLEQVRPGEKLRVRPGERVPVDGHLLEGESAVNESMLSGEAIPVRKARGDFVSAGSINGDGTFIFRAERIGRDTLLARIVQQVAEAQRSRAPVQRLADQVAQVFVPLVLVVALLTFAGWALGGPAPRLTHGLLAAVSVLIIACPCALGLATPMAIMIAMGRGARAGVLFRNAEVVERMREIDTLVTDKTGTLTMGRPALMDVLTFGKWSASAVLALAASLAQGSNHPLARAIVTGAKERQRELQKADGFSSETGRGIIGRIGEHEVVVGSAAFLRARNVDETQLAATSDKLHANGHTFVYVAIDGEATGLLHIADPVRESTAAALALLRADGVRVIVASGDARASVAGVTRRFDFEEVHAELLPGEKLTLIEQLQKEGRRVAMAGDGINDAPALAQADVGIAMGSGDDIAKQSADITLPGGDLRGIARARRLSRATLKNIRQNLFFAFAYNILGIPIAAGLLYPLTGALLSPMLAALAMSLSSVSVIGNATRLRRAKL